MNELPGRKRLVLATCVLALLAGNVFAADSAPTPWLLGTAHKIPSEYTNQESGYAIFKRLIA